MAPSVRIRRGSYSPLSESPTIGNRARPLAEIFNPPSPPHGPTDRNAIERPSSALSLQEIPEGALQKSGSDRRGSNASRSPVRTRPRAGSRVTNHVMHKASLRALYRTPSPATSDARNIRPSTGDSHRTTSPPPHVRVTIEGSHADVQLDGTSEQHGRIGSALSLSHSAHSARDDDSSDEENHHDDIVEHLDVIDAQVATVSNLTNAANAILIPPLSFYSRKPVVMLSSPDRGPDHPLDPEKGRATDQFDDSLDRHVDDILKRPSKFRRTMQGVWSFLKTPMGIITGIYGFCVVFWGAAIVIFLLKIINFHNSNTQGFWIEVSSQVTNGLFTVTGIGLIPPRLLDTYRIYKIWHYKRRTRSLRAKAGLPQLYDEDDLPDPAYDPSYVHVLSEAEQRDLHHQQVRFQKHQTWYRPHGTETHRAFPINTALLVCLFNDGNSVFQIILCACMWSLNRFQRPAWTTGSLIPLSFLCGIASAVCMWRGGAKTKRTKEVQERLRECLAQEPPDHGEDGGEWDGVSAEASTSAGTREGGLIAKQLSHASTSGHHEKTRDVSTSDADALTNDEMDVEVSEQMNVPSIP
ncbi:hypothetical protein PLICRDRAFT_33917 [Plicaturopsis crispa FD-325 SS-3]|nr:hypothetical protein PLICRDRAFT_33917 [Plicaturopsis crispa FD-325 SS-3]